MARAGWEDHGDGIWFATYKSRSDTWALLIEQTDRGFVESACHRSEDEYVVLGVSDSLKEAKKHIIAALQGK